MMMLNPRVGKEGIRWPISGQAQAGQVVESKDWRIEAPCLVDDS